MMSDESISEEWAGIARWVEGFNGYAAADPSAVDNLAPAAIVHHRLESLFRSGGHLADASQTDLKIALFVESREFLQRGWGPEGEEELAFPRALAAELQRRE